LHLLEKFRRIKHRIIERNSQIRYTFAKEATIKCSKVVSSFEVLIETRLMDEVSTGLDENYAVIYRENLLEEEIAVLYMA
jgi:hypothetical protein